MLNKIKLCPDCGYELTRKYNSTIYNKCPRCKVVKKIVKGTISKNQSNSRKFDFYKTTAWNWCKKYVLLYYCDDSGMVKCSTSPNLEYHVTDKNIHVGHWIKYRDGNSTNNRTALEFHNLAPQSARDNIQFNGKEEQMEVFLAATHGLDAINELMRLKRLSFKLDPVTLQEISDKYKDMFNDLLKKRQIKNPFK